MKEGAILTLLATGTSLGAKFGVILASPGMSVGTRYAIYNLVAIHAMGATVVCVLLTYSTVGLFF